MQSEAVTTNPLHSLGEVRVRVVASAINPADYKVLLGTVKFLHGRNRPPVVGYDFSGTVDAVGPDVRERSVGDEIFGFLGPPMAERRLLSTVTAPAITRDVVQAVIDRLPPEIRQARKADTSARSRSARRLNPHKRCPIALHQRFEPVGGGLTCSTGRSSNLARAGRVVRTSRKSICSGMCIYLRVRVGLGHGHAGTVQDELPLAGVAHQSLATRVGLCADIMVDQPVARTTLTASHDCQVGVEGGCEAGKAALLRVAGRAHRAR